MERKFSSTDVILLGSTVQLVKSGGFGEWLEPPYVLWTDVPCAAAIQTLRLTKVREERRIKASGVFDVDGTGQ